MVERTTKRVGEIPNPFFDSTLLAHFISFHQLVLSHHRLSAQLATGYFRQMAEALTALILLAVHDPGWSPLDTLILAFAGFLVTLNVGNQIEGSLEVLLLLDTVRTAIIPVHYHALVGQTLGEMIKFTDTSLAAADQECPDEEECK